MRREYTPWALVWPIWLGAALCLLPMMGIIVSAFGAGSGTITHLAETVLPRYIGTTLILVVSVALGTGAIGTSAAWLVTMTDMPGRRTIEIALVLPLAFPAYVLAYAYTHILDHPGVVQATLRDLTGWGPRDYWFPEIRSTGGAAAMLIFVLYPYVYLLARAAFLGQSATVFHAARALGRTPWQAFFAISLPMARPAIAGGMLLATMETIADFGTVSFFGVQTFTTGIYQSWLALGDRPAAAQLSLCLLAFALALVALERRSRGNASFQAGRKVEALTPISLGRGVRWVAFTWCLAPILVGVVIPVIALTSMAIGSEQDLLSARYLGFIQNSLILAGAGAFFTVFGAILIGYGRWLVSRRGVALAAAIARIGYALPGGVIAVGLLVPFAAFDNALDATLRERFGISSGLLLTGSIWVLVMAYVIRFMAAALGAYEAGQVGVNRNLDAAARTLGRGTFGTLARVHLPIVRPAVFTAFLIVFVDVMKELPATLIMRPFNYDTLAIQAHRLASDERL
ncbi:MAG: iron ABC transporter permease, partial [Pseudomonadota bacterium]